MAIPCESLGYIPSPQCHSSCIWLLSCPCSRLGSSDIPMVVQAWCTPLISNKGMVLEAMCALQEAMVLPCNQGQIRECALLLCSLWWPGLYCWGRHSFKLFYHVLATTLSFIHSHETSQEDGNRSVLLTSVSPKPGIAPGTNRWAISICWIN
jgi:hypothetical protein